MHRPGHSPSISDYRTSRNDKHPEAALGSCFFEREMEKIVTCNFVDSVPVLKRNYLVVVVHKFACEVAP